MPDCIFDQIERRDNRYRHHSECFFDYYNVSARPEIQATRELVEQWYAEFPAAGKADIRGRLRSGDNTDFLSAFFELYLCRLCRCSGFSAAIYPGMSNHARKSHPDFILSREEQPVLYLEATLAQEPKPALAARHRQAELEDALNRLNCPDFSLWLDTSGTATENIPTGKAQRQVQHWLNGLKVEQVIEEMETRGDAALPTLTASHGGLKVTVTARPKSLESRGSNSRPLELVAPDDLREWDTRDDIRRAVLRKANCYGDLKFPYIVAINVMNELFEFDDIAEGLFGQPVMEIRRGPQGAIQRRVVRADGAWTRKGQARNTLVSGVLITNNLIPRSISTQTPLLIHNPWAERPLPMDAWKLPQKSIDTSTGKIVDHLGLQARDILGIPEGWPIRAG